jgi:ketosteroid isomerase-like protein
MTIDQNTEAAAGGEPTGFSGSAVVTQMLAAFYAGDLEKLQTYLADDIETYQSENLPYSGRYHGIDGFTGMASTIGTHYAVENLHTRMLDSGDETVIYMDLRFTSHATGRTAETSNVEWYTFRDGKVARINIYYKDPVIVAALLD